MIWFRPEGQRNRLAPLNDVVDLDGRRVLCGGDVIKTFDTPEQALAGFLGIRTCLNNGADAGTLKLTAHPDGVLTVVYVAGKATFSVLRTPHGLRVDPEGRHD